MDYIQSVVKAVCDSKNIEFKVVSKGLIMILKKDNKIRYISKYKFCLNNYVSGIICDDKYALFDTLKEFGIPVCSHFIVFRRYDESLVLDYVEKYGYNVIAKINKGTCGKGIIHVTNKDELFDAIGKLHLISSSISLSPFYDIKCEYRSVILNDRVELFYGKQRPVVEGDGIKTIYELLCEFNENYFSKISDESLSRVLPVGEKYMYSFHHNLSKGAKPFYVNGEVAEKIKSLALKCTRLLNMKFASVDIIELKTGEIMVLEINTGVMMENYSKMMADGGEVSYRIYEKAIDIMFEDV